MAKQANALTIKPYAEVVCDEMNDDFVSAIFDGIKNKIGKENIQNYIYLCDRSATTQEQIIFDKFGDDWLYICQEIELKILNKIENCYLNEVTEYLPNKLFLPIPSQIGCLGVVMFTGVGAKKVKESSIELFIRKAMSALGHTILSLLCSFSNVSFSDENKKLIKKEFDRKENALQYYFPFATKECVTMSIDIRGYSKIRSVLIKKGECEELLFVKEFSNSLETIMREHYGVVNGFWGGSAMVVFNTLLCEDKAVACQRALCAAKRIDKTITDMLKKINNDNTYDDYESVGIKIGIGSSMGNIFFFGFGSNYNCYNYNGIGGSVIKTKKIENFAGRVCVPFTNCNDGNPINISKNGHIVVSTAFWRTLSSDNKHDMGLSDEVYKELGVTGLYCFDKNLEFPKCSNIRKCKWKYCHN